MEEIPFEPDEPEISETSVEPDPEETPVSKPEKEDDDSWLEEVRLDDIDLDIQEDDE